MEDLSCKSLTSEEKDKLKEKLALLKKEYKRTFNRLQRSQRAERVKTHVKKTIAEQNLLLNQEGAASLTAEQSINVDDICGNARESQSSLQTSKADKERKSSVTFNLQPEVLSVAGESPCYSESGSSGQDADVAYSVRSGRNHLERTQRSRLRLSRSMKRESSAGPSPLDITMNELEVSQDIRDPGSPVFKKSGQNLNCNKGDTDVEEHVCCAENKQLADPSTPDGSHLDPCILNTSSTNDDYMPQSLHCFIHRENTPPKQIKENDTSIAKKLNECPLSALNSPVMELQDRRASRNFKAVPQLEYSMNASPHKFPSTCLEEPVVQHGKIKEVSSLEEDNNPLSSCTLVEGLLFPVEYYVRTTRRLSNCQRKVDLDAVIQSHLGSSRRGSRGRQKQNRVSGELESPGLSTSPNECATPRSAPSHLSLTPLSHPNTRSKARSTSQSRRGRGKYSSPKSEAPSSVKNLAMHLEFDGIASSVTGGSQSEKENCEEQTQTKMYPLSGAVHTVDGDEKSKVTDASHLNEGQTRHTEYALRPRNISSHRNDTLAHDMDDFGTDECPRRTVKRAAAFLRLSQSHCVESAASSSFGFQSSLKISAKDKKSPMTPGDVSLSDGSPFQALSERLSLKHLSICLDIKDFHLPDDEFGILKLEKLKCASQVEPFVHKAPSQRRILSGRRQKKDTSTAPSMDNLSIVQTTGEKCPERDAIPVISCEDHPDNVVSAAKASSTIVKSLPDPIVPPNENLMPSPGIPDIVLPNTLGQYPIILPGQDFCTVTQEEQKQCSTTPRACKKKPIPLIQPCDGEICDHPSHYIDCKRDCTNSPVTDMILARGELLPPSASSSPITEHKTSIQNGIHPDIDPPNPSLPSPVKTASTDCHQEVVTATSPAKELCCSVLFSTSMCSAPQECDIGLCTPGFPFLGFTPAALSSPRCGASPCRSRFQTQTVIRRQSRAEEVLSEELLQEDDDNKIVPIYKDDWSSRAEPQVNGGEAVAQCNTLVLDEEKKSNVRMCDEDSAQLFAETQRSGPGCDEMKTLEGGPLRLMSQIQGGCGASYAVDLCTIWWEFSSCAELCIMAASEYSLRLWRPQAAGHWEAAHTWNFMEMPVIQIIPLSGEKNTVCVALGNLEIREIWALSSYPERESWGQQMVKQGHTDTALGLSRRRLVSSSGSSCGQVVEIFQISEEGRIVESHTLMPPGDRILAFFKLEEEKEALVGSTASNNVVIWNSVTGQLLSRIYVGDLCPSSTCLSVSSDAGLLFLVLASPYSSDRETSGSCIFRLIAANPRSALCANVMSYELPEGHSDRYLEGDVISKSAAAVLSSGSIAFWDLDRRQCCGLLSPNSGQHWCLVRWAQSSSHLVAAQKDGTISMYEYTGTCSKEKIRKH